MSLNATARDRTVAWMIASVDTTTEQQWRICDRHLTVPWPYRGLNDRQCGHCYWTAVKNMWPTLDCTVTVPWLEYNYQCGHCYWTTVKNMWPALDCTVTVPWLEWSPLWTLLLNCSEEYVTGSWLYRDRTIAWTWLPVVLVTDVVKLHA
jgi:hypothetical protein